MQLERYYIGGDYCFGSLLPSGATVLLFRVSVFPSVVLVILVNNVKSLHRCIRGYLSY